MVDVVEIQVRQRAEPDETWTATLDQQVTVRDATYLWGSAGVVADVTFTNPVALHVANDRLGESITLKTVKADGTEDVIGTLLPAEQFTIALTSLAGVIASCALASTVRTRMLWP